MRQQIRDEIYKECNKSDINCSPEEPTLLDKAIDYRRRYSVQWEHREKDRAITAMESFGIHREDSFLTKYYQREDEIVIEKKIAEAKRKLKAPQLEIQMQYKFTTDDVNYSEEAFRRNSFPSKSDINDCDIFNVSPVHRKKSPIVTSELLITVLKAKYLLNWMQDGAGKYDTCKITCTMHPQSKKKQKCLKTKSKYVNLKGTSRFHHVFKIYGFTPEELEEKQVVFEVIGKNRRTKETIGTFLLGGLKANICDATSNYRKPTKDEYEPWQQAIKNIGTSFHRKIKFQKVNEEEISKKCQYSSKPGPKVPLASPTKSLMRKFSPAKRCRTRTL